MICFSSRSRSSSFFDVEAGNPRERQFVTVFDLTPYHSANFLDPPRALMISDAELNCRMMVAKTRAVEEVNNTRSGDKNFYCVK
jgi:hypothetical protein